jgi:hypothetical protein
MQINHLLFSSRAYFLQLPLGALFKVRVKVPIRGTLIKLSLIHA